MSDEAQVEEAPREGGAPVARRREAGGWKAARWVRRAVQIVALVFFIYLLFAALQRRAAFPYADFFFRLDPLAALGTMLAARQWLPHLALAVVTAGAALVAGRVWCGWICPLGTLLGWFRFRAALQAATRVPPRLRSVKYVLLVVIVVMAALGSMTLLVLDPIALLTRGFTTSLIPGFDYVVGAVESTLVGWGPGSGVVTWVEAHFRGTVLPVYQPHYAQGAAIFLACLFIVLLNVLAERFWCRYLCPLGALLGLIAKVQALRPLVGDGCSGCNACVRACRAGAIEGIPPGAGGGASCDGAIAAAVGDPGIAGAAGVTGVGGAEGIAAAGALRRSRYSAAKTATSQRLSAPTSARNRASPTRGLTLPGLAEGESTTALCGDSTISRRTFWRADSAFS